jgi:hypothetical protein
MRKEPGLVPPGSRPLSRLVLTVLVGVMLAGFLGMLNRVDVMPVRDMRMVAGALMVTGFVVIGCCSMVASGVFVMLRGLAMMLGAVCGHDKTSGVAIQLRMQYR